MAESAVNISSIQHKKPNIFELVAQESLMNHIHPALKALCLYAAEKNTSVFGPILKWYEEVFLGANLILQYYYLKAFNSSFSEAFYGLKRIKAFSDNAKSPLPSKAFAASLFFLAVVPYIHKKINAQVTRYENQLLNQGQTDDKFSSWNRMRKTVMTAYGALRMYYLISYTAGFTRFHDPLLKLSGVELIYHDRDMPSWKDIWKALLSSRLRTPKVTLKLALKLVASSLEIGAFFIQFLSWWHSDKSKISVTKLPIPKAPHVNIGTVLCPICLKRRKNEVVLLTSGYVFCYLCIKTYLDKNGICPVTNLPSNVNNLVRIYSADS